MNRARGVQQPESVRFPVISDRRAVMAAYDSLPPAVRRAISGARMENLSILGMARDYASGRASAEDLVRQVRWLDAGEVQIDAWAHYGPDHPDAGGQPSPFELYLFGFGDKAEALFDEDVE